MGSRRPAAIVAEATGETYAAVRFDGGLVIVRWFTDGKPEELGSLADFIVEAAVASGGPVDLIAIASQTPTLPSPRLRVALSDFVLRTRGAIDATHVVLIGKGGFWQTIVRSITTGLMTAAGAHGRVTQDTSVERAIDALAAKRALSRVEVRRLADAKGLLRTP